MKKISHILGDLVLVFTALLCILPFVYMMLMSLKSTLNAYDFSFSLSSLTFKHYQTIFSGDTIGRYLLNSIIVAFAGVALTLFTSCLAGYAFAKLKFRGKKLLFGIVLVQMSLPSQIFIIPQYQMVAKMGMANTVFALVFPGLVSAFGVFFLRQTYMSIPDEVGEAAYLDGCNQWQTFYKIMFPLTGTSVAALTIFTAVFAYGDLMWPQIVNNDVTKFTLSAGLATLRGMNTTDFPMLMAGSLLAMLPMIVLYLIFQRQFVEGIAGTGGK